MSHPDCFCESYYGYICEHCRNSWRRPPATALEPKSPEIKVDDSTKTEPDPSSDCHCHRINHECHEHPAQTQLKDLSLTVKLIDHNAEIWTVIKHEPEVQRVKLRKEGPGMHPEWDAPEWTPVTLENTPQGAIWLLHCVHSNEQRPAPTEQNEAAFCFDMARRCVLEQQWEQAHRWAHKADEIAMRMAWKREAEP